MVRRLKNISTVEQRARGYNSQQVRGSNQWIDPFPEMHGTQPEKMVYAELTRRGIPFLFLNDIEFTIPEIDFNKWYQADFVFPDLKLIIEVQGAYWHSKPEALEADAFKLAVYESTGWKALAWWDFDIVGGRLFDLFDAEPLLVARQIQYGGAKSTELPVQRRTKVDTSKGIRTLNEKRFRGKIATVAKKKVRKAQGFYAT